ncbi:acetate--CoA ligase family protein [Pseudonocardia adelaidensis]|uniref:Acetate--CoA ligase family protein n=1 Tax=Pseudonocardia adelaidensis TaxID=648754 RepID=A0ABP9NH61_9PSEU
MTRGRSTRDAVGTLLDPGSIALVGASADQRKFSGQPLRNLLDAGYPGKVYPVNPRGGEILGVPVLRSIAELPPDVDVALVLVPAAAAVRAVAELAGAGVAVAIVAVSGFAEMGTEEGAALQAELADLARRTGIRILGPNCNGVYRTAVPLPLGYNHTHSQRLPAGRVGLVSHSGAMLGGFVPALARHGHGLSTFVSCGNEADLGLVDIAGHLLEDPDTEVIALILDGVSDGPSFRALARQAAERGKPLVALKLGNSARGSEATQAHSSRLAGAAGAFEAVFAADGVVSVPTLETLALAAAVLADGRMPAHRGVVGASTSGAGAILLADLLSAADLEPPALSPGTAGAMGRTAGFARVLNPFDIGAAGPDTAEQNLRALAGDPAAGTLLFYLTPVPTPQWRIRLAEAIAAVAAAEPRLPIILIGPAPLHEDEEAVYRRARVPVTTSALDAVAVVQALTRPYPPVAASSAPAGAAGGAHSEHDSRLRLATAGIPFPVQELVTTADDAERAAARIGCPVVLKATGSGIAHKSELHLVEVGVPDAAAVRERFADLDRRARALDPDGYQGVLVSELVADGVDVVAGITVDPDLGPFVLVGAGGVLTELIGDVAMAPAPVDEGAARRLLARTRVSRLLDGYRGGPRHDREALVRLLVALSEAAVGIDDLEAIDLNPVRVGVTGALALDALITTRDPAEQGET